MTAQKMRYADKLRACKREALITVGILVLLIIIWIALGFGLAGSSARICGIPLWVVCGTVGTWVAAIIASVILSRVLFKDFNFEADDEDESEGEGERQC